MSLLRLISLVVMLAAGVAPALAQTSATTAAEVELQLITGSRDSLIESSTCAGDRGAQTLLGAALRLHPQRRTGFGVEVAMAQACDRPAFTYYQPRAMVQFQAIRDIGSHAHVRPYVIASGGLVNHRQLYPSSRYPETRFMLAGGGGVRVLLPKRFVVSPEFQIGADGALFTRFTVGLGYRLR